MKISAIKRLSNYNSGAQSTSFKQSKNSINQNQVKQNLPTSAHYADVLFAGRKEKRQALSHAKAHMRHSLASMPDVRFYAQRLNESAPEIYKEIVEEENKAKNVIAEVYKVADKGLKNNFQTYTKEDGSRVEFEPICKGDKAKYYVILEYDKEGTLLRETRMNYHSIETITTFNPETTDIIEVSYLKPSVIYKDVLQMPNEPKNGELCHIGAVYNFENPDKKEVSYDVNSKVNGVRSIEKKYAFNSRGTLEEMLFLHDELEDGSSRSHIEIKTSYTSKPDDLHLDTVKKGVMTNADGNFRADEVVEMHFLGEYPNAVFKNIERNSDGTRTSDYVYMFSGGKLLMVKSGEEKTTSEYKANKIYKFSNRGLEEYMEECSMPIISDKSQDYTAKKKIEF